MTNSRKFMVYLLIFSFMIGFLISSYSPTFLFLNTNISSSKDSSQQPFSPVSGQIYEYEPYGVYIDAQNYYQGNVYESDMEQRKLHFTFHKTFGGDFDLYRIFIDSIQYEEIYYPYNDVYYYLPTFMFQNASVYNVTCAVHHYQLDKWINASTIVNITENYPRFYRYYWNFYLTQWNSINLDWTLFLSDYGYFNYSLFIDDIPYSINYNAYYSYHGYPISVYVSGDQFSTPNIAHQLKFIVSDANGKTTVNQFRIIVASQNNPWINQISQIPNQCRLWETQDVKLSVTAHDNDGDLDKIYIFIVLNNFYQPFTILEDAMSDQIYEIPISQYRLDKLINANSGNSLRFSAVAVDKSRRASLDYREITFNYQNTGYWQPSSVDQRVDKGKFIGEVENAYKINEKNTSLVFKLNIVALVKSSVNIKVNLLNAQSWYNNLPWENRGAYKRGEYNDQTFATWEYKYTENSEVMTVDLAAGCVFWVLVSNYSAIEWPIRVKITYPSEINPDPNLKEPALQLLERKDYGWQANWYAYTNENLTLINRDERILQVDTYAVEVNLYNEGLFGFGRDQALYANNNNNKGFYIAGYDLGLFIVILGAVSAFLLTHIFKRFHSS